MTRKGNKREIEHSVDPQCEADTIQVNEQLPDREDHPQEVSLFSASLPPQTDEQEEMFITNIRVTDAVLGLRRIPAGFYAAVYHSGLEWKTDNKRVSVDNDIVEWDSRQITIPSDPSATVGFGIYASFELQPTLGCGEQLRKLTVTVKQLLEYNAKALSLTLFPNNGDVISPCSSILIAIGKGKCTYDEASASVSRATDTLPLSSTAESQDELANATNEGHSALSRYRMGGEQTDLERSIEEFERALRLCSMDHSCRAVAQSNLALAQFAYCRVDGAALSFDIPINLYHDALAARPVGHLDRPCTLIQLATVYFARLKKERNESDAAQTEALLQEVINLSASESHERRAAVFMLQLHAKYKMDDIQHDLRPSVTDVDPFELGVHLLHEFACSGDIEDVQQAILFLERSVQSSSHGEQRYFSSSANLGAALVYRYHRLGVLSDLENAIMRFRDVIKLTPDQDPDKPRRLSNLGYALQSRFERLGEISDLQDAISRFWDAIKLMRGNQHPGKPGCLTNLGNALQARFDCLGDIGDLQDAISTHKHADALTPDHHPEKSSYFSSLGAAMMARFEHLGEVSDLQDAISRLSDAVELIPDHDQHLKKPACLNNLGSALQTRFHRLGNVSDLHDAILRLNNAVELTPDQQIEKPSRLSNLGAALQTRFEHLGEVSDLQDAISRFSGAVDLTPNQHPEKPRRLNNLGAALRTRFAHLGEVGDIQDAISRLKDAVELTPNQQLDKPFYLSNLGTALWSRFDRLGGVRDLQDAISKFRDAVDLTPNQHTEKPGRLSNLGSALQTRFERLGEINDLQEVILRHGDAVELTPNQHPDNPRFINNLGYALQTRFEHLGEISDLQDAISRYRDAVELTPNKHPGKPCRLSNLGTALRSRFSRLGGVSDLHDAISRHRDAVELTPDQHPDKPGHLSNLGSVLNTRFEHLGEVTDLQDAIARHRDAVELTPNQHPDKPTHLSNLGTALQARFDLLGEVNDLEDAISQFSYSALSVTGPITARLHASRQWILCARRLGHHSLLNAYSAAISILPQLSWAGLSLTDRYRALIKGTGIVREAAAAALDSNLSETAIEWLEQGRSIVWCDLFQLRSSYDELLHAHPDHAHRLQQLSAELEHAGVAREKSMSLMSEKIPHTGDSGRESLNIRADRHHDLAIKRDKLLQEIRKFSGFERFLLQKEFSRLRASAHSGPVVILNAAESRCDALIILVNKEKPIHVSLPDFTLGRLIGLQNTLTTLLGPARDVPSEERKGNPSSEWQNGKWEATLSILWRNAVKPVLERLAFSTPGDLSRIFWCPTGPFTFLPLHAAGLYGIQYPEPGHKVSDFVVSSYIPTLSTFLAPSAGPDTTTRKNVRLLAVPQPTSDGQSPLPGVALELKHIRAVIERCSSGGISLTESVTGTVEEVLSLMKESDWVHFACHGVQDIHNPTTSGLCLADGQRLKISDIISLSRPHGGLAFLSACQTAMGDEILSDEAIHIAAGMLFAGYGGVVGSMWSISDRLAPVVAKDVYEQLFQDDDAVPDHRNAARALHNAVTRLRDNGESFSGWLPFIHVGL